MTRRGSRDGSFLGVRPFIDAGVEGEGERVELNAARLAREQPHESALVDPAGTLSWQEVADRLVVMVEVLRDRDIPAGERLAVMGHNCADTLLVYAAALLAGVGAVLVNNHLTADEVEFLLRDGRAAAVWASPECIDVATDAAQRCGVPVLAPCLDPRAWSTPLPGTPTRAWPPLDLPATTDLVYTSGTTGTPKGVELPYGPAATVGARVALLATHHLTGRGPHLVVGPMYHAGPHAAVGLLLTGSLVVIVGSFDAAAVIAAIGHHRIATTVMVPTHLVRLLALPEEQRREADVSSLRTVALTGSSCPEHVYRAIVEWFGPVTREAYGASESGVVTVITAPEWLEHPGSVGRFQAPFRALILDEQQRPCPPGRDGVVYIVDDTGRGIRYYRDVERTAAAHLEPGTFTLGDVGHVDDDGYLYITGRVSDLVISGGVNIYPAECEQVLERHPAVVDVALFGVPDDEMGERLVGIVEVDGDTTADALLTFCRTAIAGYKVPKELVIVDDVPRTAMGKLDKRALRDSYLTGDTR